MNRLDKLQSLNSILHNGRNFENSIWPAKINGVSVYIVDFITLEVMRDLVMELIEEELDVRLRKLS